MNKLKIVVYIFITLFLLSATGCSGSGKQASEIKGKFIFSSNRFEADAFITENGKTKLLLKKATASTWSSDGKMIACASLDNELKKHGFWILDSKGNKKEFVDIPAGFTTPLNLNWSPDSTKIYYTPTFHGKLGYKNKVYCYDSLSKIHTKMIELDEKFSISNMKLSPKGDKLLMEGSDKHNFPLYLSNSDGTNLRIIGQYRGNCAWYPDNEHIAYITNTTEDGQMYSKEGWGYFFRMNVNTGEVEKLFPNNTPFLLYLKISRDGKYFYYIAAAPGGGQVIFVSPIDNPDKKIQITQPIFLTPATYGRSQDRLPDWYQD